MARTLQYNDILSRLPLASTQFLTPISYDLLNFLIRVGYQRDEPFCVAISDLHQGYVGMDLPCLVYNGKPCHHNTIQKHRDLLVLLGLVDYRIIPRKETFKHYGEYTLNREAISAWVEYGYSQALDTGCLSGVVGQETKHTAPVRSHIHAMLRDTSQYIRVFINGLSLSSMERYIFDLVMSMAVAVSSDTLRNIPSRLSSLLAGSSRTQIYKNLSAVVSVELLLGYDRAERVYYIAIPADIRHSAKPRRSVRVQEV